MLAAQAADTIVSFLYRIHRDALTQTPGERVYYEDHVDFNDAFDEENESIRLGELELQPSRVLFHTDPKAYRTALSEYIAERAVADDGNDMAIVTEDAQVAK
jgi:hypothetical protein